jgi:hypothetical protein
VKYYVINSSRLAPRKAVEATVLHHAVVVVMKLLGESTVVVSLASPVSDRARVNARKDDHVSIAALRVPNI